MCVCENGMSFYQQPPQRPHRDISWVMVFVLVFIIITLSIALVISMRYMNTAIREEPVIVRGRVEIAPTPTRGIVPTPTGVVRSAKVGAVLLWKKRISRIETQEYHIQADDVEQRDPAFLSIFGGELIQAHLEGDVIGRTDISAMTIDPRLRSGDIVISEDGKGIRIALPAPQITRPIVDEQLSSFNNHKLGFFAGVDPALWQKARIEASNALVQKACEDGIQEEARAEAERQVDAMFSLGFENVEVITRAATVPCGM